MDVLRNASFAQSESRNGRKKASLSCLHTELLYVGVALPGSENNAFCRVNCRRVRPANMLPSSPCVLGDRDMPYCVALYYLMREPRTEMSTLRSVCIIGREL